MARKGSPTTQAIKPDHPPEKQLDIPARQKPINGKAKLRGETRKSNPSTKEEIQYLKEQLAEREAEISRLSSENQQLAKETAQRATELQIINNIGQTLTEGLDLQSTLERVGERLREALKLKSVGIIANDSQTGLAITYYLYHYGKRVFPEDFSPNKNRLAMRFALKMGGKPLVVNTNSEKYWRKIVGDMLVWPEIPRSFVIVPLLAGRQLVGSITIGDYEEENAFLNLPINLLETIAANMGTAIQNVRLFDETQRLLKETEQRATELQIINNIGQTLTEGGLLESMIQRVGERIQEALDVNNIAISVFDKETEHVIAPYMVRNGEQIKLTEENFDLRRYKILIHAWARAGGKGASWVINKDVDKIWRKSWRGPIADDVPKSMVVLPLLAGGEIIGGISLANYEKEDAFTDLSINLLETIASNMGTAVQNVRLFEETQRLLKETEQRATELQIINNIGQTLTEVVDLDSMIQRVGERIQAALNIKNIVISVFDEKTSHVLSSYMVRNGKQIQITEENIDLKRFKLAIQASARAGGRSWVVNRVAEKTWRKWWRSVVDDDVPKSFVTLPLLAGREVIGGITIADYEKENAFSDLSVNLLETIASNMGTAIQNVRLFDETQHLLKQTEQRATELQIINNIGQSLTDGLDLHRTLERVSRKLCEAFNVQNITILAFDARAGRGSAPYIYRNGRQILAENFSLDAFRLGYRIAARGAGKSWVVNTDAQKRWQKFQNIVSDGDEIPKSFVMVPLMLGGEVVGGIIIPDYEKENAFTDFSIGMLETIASNMSTAIQNARLFDETRRLFDEAEESRAAAEQANKAKSTFLANMSHELRTPLNAIIGFTRIVKRKAEGSLPEKQIENLDKVLVSSEHLLGLINTVLDIAKIEAGRMEVIPSKFSLSALADQCATLASPLLQPDVTLEKQLDETIGFIFSDQDKIKQIVLNLLSNAAKFTHQGKILLTVNKVEGFTSTQEHANLSPSVRISVTDSGIGISEEALGRIFEEFQQADNTTTRQYGGTGLGLTISRNLARLLGGDLTATSELGKGSTFALTLPIQYQRKPISSEARPASVQSTESQADDLSPRQTDDKSALKTILIVEDTELNIQLLTQLLESDYNLLVAKDGAQGVSTAQQQNPDLILMDISLPILDGYEATRRIRTTNSSIPIIGLSAHAMSGDAEKAKEAGCNDYMTKPVDEVLLIKKLHQFLR